MKNVWAQIDTNTSSEKSYPNASPVKPPSIIVKSFGKVHKKLTSVPYCSSCNRDVRGWWKQHEHPSLNTQCCTTLAKTEKIYPIGPNFEVNGLDWQCCLAGSSKMPPRIFVFFKCPGCRKFFLCEIHCYLCHHIFWVYYFSLNTQSCII